MMYAFNRDSIDSNHMHRILSSMKETLINVRLGIYGREDLESFCKQAILDAQTNDRFEGTVFWGFDEPGNMPSDSRCEYYYLPSYLMTLTLVNAVLQFPELLALEGMKDTLNKALKGCTGRYLTGSGFDGTAVQHSNLRLFLKSNILVFLAEHPDVGEDFSRMLREIFAEMKRCYDEGQHKGGWDHDFKAEQAELLALYEFCKGRASCRGGFQR